MAEYITREAVIEAVSEVYYETPSINLSAEKFEAAINSIPAADAAPVVHSYWESYDCSQYMGTDEYGEPKWRDGKFYVCHNHRCRRKTVVKSHYKS